MPSLTRSMSLVSLLLTAAAVPAQAQVPLSPRAFSLGGALVGGARGHESIFINPANLALPGTPGWSVGLAGLSAGALLEGISADDASDFIEYDDLSAEDRARLLDGIPAGGARLAVDARGPIAALQIGSVGVGFGYVVMGGHSVSRDIVELLLEGYEEGRTDYSTVDTRGDLMSFSDFALAYGTATGAVSWGVTGHYLRGGTLERSWMTDPRIDIAEQDISLDYYGLRAEGGSGFALDLGMAYQPHHSVTIGATVAGAYSHIGWSDDIRLRQLTLSRADFDESVGFDDFFDRYSDSEREPTDADLDLIDETPTRFLEVGAQLPTTLTVGAAWEPTRSTALMGSYSDNLTDGTLAGRWSRRLGVGIEQGLWLLAARAGISSDLDGQQLLTGGVRLGVLDLGLGRLTGEEAGIDRDGWFVSLGLSTRMR